MWPGPAAAGARRFAEDNEAMLKRWRPAAAGLLRDVNGNCWGGAPPPASWVTTRTERGLHHPRGRRVTNPKGGLENSGRVQRGR